MAEKILSMIKNNELDIKVLGMFRMGGGILRISEETFLRWISYLLEQDSITSISLAIDLFHTYFIHNKNREIPKDIALGILLNKAFSRMQRNFNAYLILSIPGQK